MGEGGGGQGGGQERRASEEGGQEEEGMEANKYSGYFNSDLIGASPGAGAESHLGLLESRV